MLIVVCFCSRESAKGFLRYLVQLLPKLVQPSDTLTSFHPPIRTTDLKVDNGCSILSPLASYFARAVTRRKATFCSLARFQTMRLTPRCCHHNAEATPAPTTSSKRLLVAHRLKLSLA